jgi:lipoate-protein ligase A
VSLPEWRLLDEVGRARDASAQMRADVDLLEAVALGGPPTLRLYTFATPALTLGRFQPHEDVDEDACARLDVDVARRPTGGQALLHGGDLTYAVAMPQRRGREGSVERTYTWLAAGIIAGLARLGVEANVASRSGPAGPVCFAGQQGADLRVGDRKVCGSAQLQRDGAVLQHGSILLRRLPFDETDVLTGSHDRERLHNVTITLEELAAPADPALVARAIVEGFEELLGLHLLHDSHSTTMATGGREWRG